MRSKDYIPRREEDFHLWQYVFITNLNEMGAENFIPAPEYEELMRLYYDYNQKYEIANNPNTRTKPSVQDRQQSRKIYESYIRDIVRTYLANNHKLTDAQRELLNITVRKKTRTRIGAPDTYPVLTVKQVDAGRILVQFRKQELDNIKESVRRNIPYGYIGAFIKYGVFDQPAKDHSELNLSVIATRPKKIISFNTCDRKKTACFSIAWETRKGETGPWSPVVSENIP
ncbi:MAG: hypothetical protein LBS54_00035 [Dysgonamonadaceae bacterium]|jgi:hypothetical protein|nr:hypothetical protein [Dysgonamonadaceae bacterium]